MERPRRTERCRDCDDDELTDWLGPPVWQPVSIEEEKTKPKWVQDMGNICAGLYKDYCEISNPFDTTTFFNKLEWMRRDADGPQFDPNARTWAASEPHSHWEVSLFHLAVRAASNGEEHMKVMQTMLEHGADVNSSHGRVFKDHPKVRDRVHGDEMSVAILQDATTRYYRDMHGMHTPLICALYQLRRRFAALSRDYIRQFKLPESREREKMEASVNFAASAVETLLLAGADPNLVMPDVQGVPPLTIAVEELCARTHNEGVGEADSFETWKWSLVDTLLDKGADPNGRDHTGATALMLVVQRVLAVEKFTAVVDLLVERGADIHLYDHWGETALRKAVRHGNATAVRLLLSKGAKFDVRPPNVFYLEMDKRVRAFLNDHIDLDTLKIGDHLASRYDFPCGDHPLLRAEVKATRAALKERMAAERAERAAAATAAATAAGWAEATAAATADLELVRAVAANRAAEAREAEAELAAVRAANPSPCTDRLSSAWKLATWMSADLTDAFDVHPPTPRFANTAILKMIRPKHNWARASLKWKVRGLVLYWGSLCLAPDKVDMEQDLASATEGIDGAVGGLGA